MARIMFEATEVLAYGPWDPDNEKMGEFIRVKFDGDQQTRRYTLDKSLNGDRPNVGEVVSLEAQSVQRLKPYIDRAGEARNAVREQIRVVGFLPPAA
jgi:hypothetical protein